jgi:hypothetical protein
VPELGSPGSVRGVFSNGHPYRDPMNNTLICFPDKRFRNVVRLGHRAVLLPPSRLAQLNAWMTQPLRSTTITVASPLSGRRRRADALASVRRPNCTCRFPACSFHKDALST